MADTGKSIRAAKTQVVTRLPNASPAEREAVVPHEVHQFRSSYEGLEGLSTAFSQFFGQAQSALGAVQEGILLGNKQKIEQENDAQKRQAVGDALAGKSMDQSLTGDQDYYSAYRAVKAQRDGYQASQEFHNWYLQDWLPSNPTGDLSTAREQWARQNLTGSQDKDYEGQVLSSFFQSSDPIVSQHTEFAYKYQTAKGMENLGAAIDATVAGGGMTPEALADFTQKARVLDPLNSLEAPARVATALLASAQNHPDQMLAVSNLLTQPGTGVNGKSFAQSWPDSFADFQNKAEAAWNQVNSVGDLKAASDLQDRLRFATSQDELAQLMVDTLKFRQKSGAIGTANTLLDAIAAKAAKGEVIAGGVNTINRLMGDDTSNVDPSDVRKYFTPWMQQNFGTNNLLELDPKDAVRVMQGLHEIVPDEAKLQVSGAITGTQDPAKQAQAITLMNTLTATSGKAYAKGFLSDSAKSLYDNVSAIAQVSNEPMESIVKRVNEARSGIKNWDAPWSQVTGEPDAQKSRQLVTDTINGAFTDAMAGSGWLGTSLFRPGVTPSAEMVDTISDVARQKAIEAKAVGRSWQDGVKDAVNDIASKAEVVPGAGGQLIVRLVKGAADGGSVPYTGDDGKPALRPRLGPQVENPQTGEVVDTLQVFKDQSQQAADKEAWLFQGGTPAGVFLTDTDPLLSSRGLFAVNQDSQPGQQLVFAAGDKITSPTSRVIVPAQFGKMSVPIPPDKQRGEITIPSTEAEMDKLFGDLPQGFKFVRQDTPHGVVWRLGYRPNYGDKGGLTLDQKAGQFGGGW